MLTLLLCRQSGANLRMRKGKHVKCGAFLTCSNYARLTNRMPCTAKHPLLTTCFRASQSGTRTSALATDDFSQDARRGIIWRAHRKTGSVLAY